jgi:hypothetical protein
MDTDRDRKQTALAPCGCGIQLFEHEISPSVPMLA